MRMCQIYTNFIMINFHLKKKIFNQLKIHSLPYLLLVELLKNKLSNRYICKSIGIVGWVGTYKKITCN